MLLRMLPLSVLPMIFNNHVYMTFSNLLVFFIIDWFVVFWLVHVSKMKSVEGVFSLMGVNVGAGGKSFGETRKLWSFSSINSIFSL